MHAVRVEKIAKIPHTPKACGKKTSKCVACGLGTLGDVQCASLYVAKSRCTFCACLGSKFLIMLKNFLEAWRVLGVCLTCICFE